MWWGRVRGCRHLKGGVATGWAGRSWCRDIYHIDSGAGSHN